MTDVSLLTSTPVVPVLVLEKTGKDQDVIYLVAFAVVGIFLSAMSLVLTGAEWLAEGSITVALASAG